MKTIAIAIKAVALAVLINAPTAQAVFTMDFVDIGNTTNVDDDTGYGAVGYNYRMGVNEVSEAMIDAYNTANPGVLITKDTRGPDKPATSVSWNQAARFVNWLNTSQGYQAAYNIIGGADDNITLWGSGVAWQKGGENLYRHEDAHYFLPSEDEWYKAAYYDPDANSGAGGYWGFTTGSDAPPTSVASGTTVGTAVYGQQAGGPADITDAGGLSPYGTMAQGGNAEEWGESDVTAPNGPSAGELRVRRGGTWFHGPNRFHSSSRGGQSPDHEGSVVGFRVAAVPEPTSISLVMVGALGVLLRRKRR